jgi:hypothetical protein
MEGDFSGSRLEAVETKGDQPQRFVLKRMTKRADWLMQATNDDHCRSVALWRYGLLNKLQPAIDHAILACARDGDGWAMLMRDVSPYLMEPGPWSTVDVKFFLDTLATIHATFWQAPDLDNPATGLCDTAGMIQTFSVNSAGRLPSDTNPVPAMIIEGWELLQEWLDPDVADTLVDLLADPEPLVQALACYPATLVHGDYRDANLALQPAPDPRAVVLDWQLAGRSVPTIDLIYFLNKPQVLLSSLTLEMGVDYYRQKLAERLGNRFDPAQWRPMLELGWLVDILRMGAVRAWFAVHPDSEANRVTDQAMLQQHNAQVRAALRWL